MTQDPTGASLPRSKSLVRVKVALLFLIFLACVIALRLDSAYEDALLAVAGVSAVLFWFVRCESCKSSIYYRAGGKRKLFFGAGTLVFLLARECPCCKLVRV